MKEEEKISHPVEDNFEKVKYRSILLTVTNYWSSLAKFKLSAVTLNKQYSNNNDVDRFCSFLTLLTVIVTSGHSKLQYSVLSILQYCCVHIVIGTFPGVFSTHISSICYWVLVCQQWNKKKTKYVST